MRAGHRGPADHVGTRPAVVRAGNQRRTFSRGNANGDVGCNDVGARRRDIGLQNVGIALVRAARRRVGHHGRGHASDLEAATERCFANEFGATDLAGFGGHSDKIVSVHVHNRKHTHDQRRAVARSTDGSFGRTIQDDHTQSACRLGVGHLVDQHVATTVADDDLARHLGGVEQRSHSVSSAKAQRLVGAGDHCRPKARVARPDQWCLCQAGRLERRTLTRRCIGTAAQRDQCFGVAVMR